MPLPASQTRDANRPQVTQDELLVETPEHTQLVFELAGIGSRFFAGLADLGIQLGLLAILLFAAVGGFSGLTGLRDVLRGHLEGWLLAAVILGAFLTFFGYPIFFEMLWNGQTPGKRFTGLRVVRDDGTPLTFFDSAVRNILRAVDIQPGIYSVGLFTMFFHKQYKRVGDMVAGTVVVKDRRAAGGLRRLRPEAVGAVAPQVESLVRAHLAKVTPQEVRLCREFLERRQGLTPAARARVAVLLAAPLLHRFGADSWALSPGIHEPFLEGLVVGYQARQETAEELAVRRGAR